jgi:drug/metabolite transporter (DMT)-like permease
MTFFLGIAQSAIMAYTLGHGHLSVPTGLSDSLLTGGVALLSFIGQIAIILALKFEQAGPVSLLRSLDVIFGFLLQFAFLGVAPDLFSGVGGAIVLGGVVIIASRKWIKTMPEGSGMRTWFGWVLR